MKRVIYKITVTNWAKHNSSKKKGHRSVLISTGFLSDPKVRQLTPTGKLLFLSCIFLAGDSTHSQFEVTHESLSFQCGVKPGSLLSQLAQLVKLQLVTIENFDALINRIEKKKNRKEENTESKKAPKTVLESAQETLAIADEFLKPRTVKIIGPNTPAIAVVEPKERPSVSVFIIEYKRLFLERYRVRFEFCPKDEGIAKRVTKNLTAEKVRTYLDAFFQMPDAWLEKTKHPVGAFETKFNEIQVFSQTGEFTTNRQSQSVDTLNTNLSLLQKVRANE